MAPRTVVAALGAALALVAPADAVQSLLHAHTAQDARRTSTSKVQRVEAVLRSRTAQLKRALWDEFGLGPFEPVTPALAFQAMNRLAQEADYLAAEDDAAASLLNDYVHTAFVPMLSVEPLVPHEEAFMQRAATSPEQLPTVESSETVVQQNAEGNLVRTTRHCRGNTCTTQTEEVTPQAEAPEDMMVFDLEDPEDRAAYEEIEQEPVSEAESDEESDEQKELDAVVAAREQEEAEEEAQESQEATLGDVVGGAIDSVGDAVRIASRMLGKDLKKAVEDSGIPPLGEIMKKVMNTTLGKGIQDFAKTVSTGNSTGLNVSFSGSNLAHAFEDFMSGLSNSSAFGNLTNSESVSSVTTVENGHLVRHTRRCRQGQCTETTEEGEAAEGQSEE